MTTRYERALGSLLGSFVGDALGAQTEFKREKLIRKSYPEGIWDMGTCPRYVGQAGQITDDSEMAIMMIQSVLQHCRYQKEAVQKAYLRWRDAGPLDIGVTIYGALEGTYNPLSQANGALMRITPIGILGSDFSTTALIHLADEDCAITHVHPICRDCNRLYAFALSLAISKGWNAQEIYTYLLQSAPSLISEPSVLKALQQAAHELPKDIDGPYKGWVLIAFQLAFYILLHQESFEQGMVEVVMHAGDADTNAVIYGALAGAIATKENIPERWISALKISNCLQSLIDHPHKRLERLAEEWVEALLNIPVVQKFS
ncbi:MAG: ADP-ribosylglycohydrolase family protein [Sphaerochaetaceae bacterium]